MRIGRVIGHVTLNPRTPELRHGALLLVEALDHAALVGRSSDAPRGTPMPEALVVYDELGAGEGQIIGISEGREASMPFYPDRVPIDAYNAAILDTLDLPI